MDGYDEILRRRLEESSKMVERVGVDQEEARNDVHAKVHGHRDEEYYKESIPKRPMQLLELHSAINAENIIKGSAGFASNATSHQIDALFDSGATHSFISDDYAKRLKLQVLEMPFSINVSAPASASMRTSWACLKLELKFGDRVSIIDLIYLPLSGIDVIIRMDWLFDNGTTLDYNRKIVSLLVYIVTAVNLEPFKSLSVVDYETRKFLSALQVEKSVKKGYQAFIIYYSTHEVCDGGIDRIGVMNEFPKVFDDRILRLPLEREIKFLIDLVSGIELISKALYRMASTELEELKN
ncbi:uncharacterized protein LOC129316486 [Prosopis cineraria]|uniref:uncharacterized protein LOC129316486 n=1 Tax=Prosopis cineraria TaxID=364024 RepID=UPI00241094BF|nr:uncharacterized protein LOC129316486 [Prosopis cineraria]